MDAGTSGADARHSVISSDEEGLHAGMGAPPGWQASGHLWQADPNKPVTSYWINDKLGATECLFQVLLTLTMSEENGERATKKQWATLSTAFTAITQLAFSPDATRSYMQRMRHSDAMSSCPSRFDGFGIQRRRAIELLHVELYLVIQWACKEPNTRSECDYASLSPTILELVRCALSDDPLPAVAASGCMADTHLDTVPARDRLRLIMQECHKALRDGKLGRWAVDLEFGNAEHAPSVRFTLRTRDIVKKSIHVFSDLRYDVMAYGRRKIWHSVYESITLHSFTHILDLLKVSADTPYCRGLPSEKYKHITSDIPENSPGAESVYRDQKCNTLNFDNPRKDDIWRKKISRLAQNTVVGEDDVHHPSMADVNLGTLQEIIRIQASQIEMITEEVDTLRRGLMPP
ncbi:hypothetical protein CYMTET_4773 [Cymbomonas tetramitiformis]|uniref:Uncharacterized protein n=1 Tax=Cymbomonas tetramitiformis TaxID=36881 RepID=A0AAE0H2E2_9CHLO|nr:hypothetical protein CYMTET_4773 [Cymbomonas tetramitiformis]|eukprot:gene4594-5626_t